VYTQSGESPKCMHGPSIRTVGVGNTVDELPEDEEVSGLQAVASADSVLDSYSV
jgi:hypothetical protein